VYARLTTVVFAPGEDFDAASLFRNVVPTLEELDGFKGMMVFSSLEGRAFSALTFWETTEALKAAEPTLESVKRAETSQRRVESLETTKFFVSGSRLVP
jgi:heme-degrading monooxygenase HmoA